MSGILREIQETVRKYADIMAKIAKVDVEVVDSEFFRVAGTGIFQQHVNEDMSAESYSYQRVIETGKLQVIYDPGNTPVCENCPKRYNCSEEIEVAMPIRVRSKTVGVIGLVGSSILQRDTILEDEKTYLELIEQIAGFIAAKAAERIEEKKNAAFLESLGYTINHMEQGALILDTQQVVIMSNHIASAQLGIGELEGKQIFIAATGDQINGQVEYVLRLDGTEYTVIGNLYRQSRADDSAVQILIFTRSADLYRKVYALTASFGSGILIGSSEATASLRKEIVKISRSSSTVLITGESGTGKEVVANAIWRTGNRSHCRFIVLNCAAIPDALLESELFGYVKGAFTGADPNGRVGKFELANNGVIFLDEIGDMPLYLQAKLLRVLQERVITRIGSNQQIPIDVRVIAATNKDLKSMIENGKFREDLFYRLNVIPIRLFPLRSRREDIPDLAAFFAARCSERFGRPVCKITDVTMELLIQHPWYGNVRELENTIEFMVNMCDSDGILGAETLPKDFITEELKNPYLHGGSNIRNDSGREKEQDIVPLCELERQEIMRAVTKYGYTTEGKKRAAELLGISLATLYRKLENFSK